MRRPVEFWVFVARGIAMILGSGVVIAVGGAFDLIRGRGSRSLRRAGATKSSRQQP